MKILRTSALLFAAALLAALSCFPLHAQMVSPSIDTPGEPFSYFSAPTDEIGMMYADRKSVV